MPDETDWSVTTFEGNRRQQHEDFLRLSFREKLALIEELSAVAEQLGPKRPSRTAGTDRTAGTASEGKATDDV